MLSGTRHNDGKPKLSLVLDAREALEGAALVLGDGLIEYGRGNWSRGLDHAEVVDSLMRHLLAYNSGEDVDPKSGRPHVDHITCNALFLATHVHRGIGVDGRTATREAEHAKLVHDEDRTAEGDSCDSAAGASAKVEAAGREPEAGEYVGPDFGEATGTEECQSKGYRPKGETQSQVWDGDDGQDTPLD